MMVAKPAVAKIVEAAYKIAALNRGETVQFSSAFWKLVDGYEVSGVESKRGRPVLRETQINGKVFFHWDYKWPNLEDFSNDDESSVDVGYVANAHTDTEYASDAQC